MTELKSLKFYPITTTLGPKAEREGKGKISSPVSVSYEGKKQTNKQERRKLMLYFPEGCSGKGICLFMETKKEEKCLSNGSRK